MSLTRQGSQKHGKQEFKTWDSGFPSQIQSLNKYELAQDKCGRKASETRFIFTQVPPLTSSGSLTCLIKGNQIPFEKPVHLVRNDRITVPIPPNAIERRLSPLSQYTPGPVSTGENTGYRLQTSRNESRITRTAFERSSLGEIEPDGDFSESEGCEKAGLSSVSVISEETDYGKPCDSSVLKLKNRLVRRTRPITRLTQNYPTLRKRISIITTTYEKMGATKQVETRIFTVKPRSSDKRPKRCSWTPFSENVTGRVGRDGGEREKNHRCACCTCCTCNKTDEQGNNHESSQKRRLEQQSSSSYNQSTSSGRHVPEPQGNTAAGKSAMPQTNTKQEPQSANERDTRQPKDVVPDLGVINQSKKSTSGTVLHSYLSDREGTSTTQSATPPARGYSYGTIKSSQLEYFLNTTKAESLPHIGHVSTSTPGGRGVRDQTASRQKCSNTTYSTAKATTHSRRYVRCTEKIFLYNVSFEFFAAVEKDIS